MTCQFFCLFFAICFGARAVKREYSAFSNNLRNNQLQFVNVFFCILAVLSLVFDRFVYLKVRVFLACQNSGIF